MSVVMTDTTTKPAQPSSVELMLHGTSEIPRRLALRANTRGYLQVFVYKRPGKPDTVLGRPLAYSNETLSECRLVRNDCLWMGHAAFDVTREESARIEAAFAPVGLQVEDKAGGPS